MNELHLFAGAGGGILGGQLLGHTCVCAVEREPYAQAVLVARQNDGTFPPFPIWDDVCTFDGKPWAGIVDIVAGGFPCQDISAAGAGEGIDGERSGLWGEMARIIREVRPRYVFVENSPMLTSRGLGRVLGDLAEMGFDAQWGVVSAADVGAPHLRERIWIVAYPAGAGREGHETMEGRAADQPDYSRLQSGQMANMVDTHGLRELQPQGCQCDQRGWACDCGDAIPDANDRGVGRRQQLQGSSGETLRRALAHWPIEPGVGRVVDGMAHRAHRIKSLGNGQVSRVAATAFDLLTNNKRRATATNESTAT